MKKSSAILLVVLAISLLLQSLSLAWISDNGLSSPVDITAHVHKNYFEYGNGTAEEPYGIASPVQLYYFSWLQYLGYFNPDDNNDDKIDTTYYFELANDIDMGGLVLPPIGTQDYPFISNFDGQGYTVSNLVVQNAGALSDPPKDAGDALSGVEIIGFFGVIGGLSDYKYTYATEANEVKNLAIENLTIATQTDRSLIGLVAGYVNGTVDCVGVLGGTINIKDGITALTYTKNISDYSLVGFCTDEYKDSVYVMDVVLSQPGVSDIYNVVPDMTSDGEGHGWGGSVKMDEMFTMLKTIRDSNNYSTNYSTFIYERVDAIINGKRVTLSMDDANKRVYYDPNFGAIVYSPRSGTTYGSGDNNQDYNYLSGSTRVTLYECESNGSVDGYYITDGTNYLTISGIAPNAFIINTTSKSDAAIWRFSNGANGGTAYTVVDGYMYYLCLANNALTIYSVENSTAKTSWSVSNTGISSDNAYIVYRGNEWTITRAGKKITNGNGGYLTVTNGNVGYTNIENDAVNWEFENLNGTGSVYATVGNTTYYLRYNNGLTLTTTQNQATDWTYGNSRLSCRVRSWMTNTTYYLVCSGTTWSASTSTSNSTVVLADVVVRSDANLVKSEEQVDSYKYTSTFKLDNNESNRYFDEDGKEVITNNLENKGITCYPLTFEYNSNNRPEVSSGNTGYVISSSYDTTTTGTYPDRTGDIRVSKYPASSLGNSRTNPYCMNYTTSSFTQVNSLNGKGLNKYSDCYDDYNSTTQSSCYGIHFMNSVISKDSLVSVDNVTIFGKTYDNYEMPTACIDFNLKESGFINFFAGTYFSNNNTFFSLHKIERGKDENDPETYGKILSIKEIKNIYGVVRDGQIDFSVPYYYSYKDGTTDPIDSKYASEPYQIIFDTDWITNPREYGTWHSSATYYFEVPVYAGEYALGSVEGKTGAYLIYLDLAANAQIIERQKDYEQIVEEKYEGSIPKGVELLAPGETIANGVDPKDSAFVSINVNSEGKTGVSGDVVFETTDGVTITHTAKDGTSAEYIGPGVTLKDGNGDVMTMQCEKTTIVRTTYRDRNLNTGDYTVTVITETHKSDGTISYERTITKGTWNSETNAPENMGTPETKKSETEKLYPTTKDSVENEGGGAIGADLVGLYFAYGQKVSLTVKYEYVYDATNPTYNITITATKEGGEDVDVEDVDIKAVLKSTTSGVTVYINGQELESTTDPQTVTVTVTSGGEAAQ